MSPYVYFLISVILLGAGLYLILTRRNAIGVLIGVELVLNAALLNLIAFDAARPAQAEGRTAALYLMVLAAAEAAVALALVLNLYRRQRSVELDDASELRG
ncbi:MAG: NADH-quinone oxidoreductase subunit NuoK [Gemmatimonadales bacterium]|nr:NADH-quinone oxidoreductase subunit NuoK [Gemmatimonadales bacterium]